MIASLPMYDRPEIAGFTDIYWHAIARALRTRGIDAPDQLTRGEDPWDHWRSADLVLSQTCGLPYRARLHGTLQLVGTPDFGLPGCAPGYYNSVIIARADDKLDPSVSPRLAYNQALSQSGWAAAQTWFAGLDAPPGKLVETGGHTASARAVAEGLADLAAIDAATWELMRRHDPWSDALREVDRTEPTPGLPFVTALGQDDAAIFEAVEEAIDTLPADARAALMLNGIVKIGAEAYLAQPIPAPPG